ncbi:MAG: DUF3054 domain-containing protein [Chloroflexi bacterium]|nr:DUF3054 domain-containing protein [Chloroflexota bacterium]
MNDKTPRIWLLALGDAIAILLFVIIGRRSHSLATGLDAAIETLRTVAPFWVGWFLSATWLAAYRRSAWSSAGSAIMTVLKAILPALIIAILLRALIEGGFSPISFYLVGGTAMLLLLILWRLIYWKIA